MVGRFVLRHGHCYCPGSRPKPVPVSISESNLSVEERVTNIISLLTPRRKSTSWAPITTWWTWRPRTLSEPPGDSRLQPGEGLHGLSRGRADNPNSVPTTTFIQSIGWGKPGTRISSRRPPPRKATSAAQPNRENSRGGSQSLIIARPMRTSAATFRWGRTEECYGEDAYLNGTLTAAFVRGLQGNDPKYWQTAALLKHFLANSNENGPHGSSSNFDERLLREITPCPSAWASKAGARSYMAAYNAMNGIPMTAQPILKEITSRSGG